MSRLVEIPLPELNHDDFDEDNRIGGGGFSVVYKGTYHGAKARPGRRKDIHSGSIQFVLLASARISLRSAGDACRAGPAVRERKPPARATF